MKFERITPLQATMLLTCFLIGSSVILNPAESGGHDAWLSTLIGWGMGYILLLMVAAVASLHPGKSLVGILEDCFGQKAGRVLGFFYALFFIGMSGVILHVYGLYEISVEFPETPVLFIDICFILVAAYTVKLGLEVMGRLSEIFLVVFALVVTVTLASFFTDFHINAFEPVLENGLWPPFLAGIKFALIPFSEFCIALTILPNVTDQKALFKISNRVALISGLFLMVIMARNILVVGVNLSSRNIFPAEKIFRLMPDIDIYPLLDLNVIMTGMLKVSVMIFASVRTLGEVFSLKEYKVLAFPTAALAVSVSYVFIHDLFDQLQSLQVVALIYVPAFCLMLILMLFLSLVRKKAPPGSTPA